MKKISFVQLTKNDSGWDNCPDEEEKVHKPKKQNNIFELDSPILNWKKKNSQDNNYNLITIDVNRERRNLIRKISSRIQPFIEAEVEEAFTQKECLTPSKKRQTIGFDLEKIPAKSVEVKKEKKKIFDMFISVGINEEELNDFGYKAFKLLEPKITFNFPMNKNKTEVEL